MSVIVAVKENGVVYMGADTQTTIGRRKQIGLNKTDSLSHIQQHGLIKKDGKMK